MNRARKKGDARTFRASDAALRAVRRALRAYTVLVEPDEELGFVGSAVEMPGVMADGSTRDECISNLEFALETALATMVEDGKPLPGPSSSATRTEEVTLRLTAREK